MCCNQPQRAKTIARCTRCGRGFVWVSPESDRIDRWPPPYVRATDGRHKVPMFKGDECGGEIVMLADATA